MTTHQPIMQFDFSTSEEKYTLKGLKQPKELFHALYRRPGLAIISGTDIIEIRKTMMAIGAAFESYRGKALELRTEDNTEPLPDTLSIKPSEFFTASKRIMYRGHHSTFLVTGELKTPEMLEVVTKYTSEGGLVIAPVIASSAQEALRKMCEVGRDTAPFSFANSFTYVAQQTLIQDPFDAEGGIVSSIDITIIDDTMRNDLVRFKA